MQAAVAESHRVGWSRLVVVRLDVERIVRPVIGAGALLHRVQVRVDDDASARVREECAIVIDTLGVGPDDGCGGDGIHRIDQFPTDRSRRGFDPGLPGQRPGVADGKFLDRHRESRRARVVDGLELVVRRIHMVGIDEGVPEIVGECRS